MNNDKELLQQALDVMLAAIKAGDWEVDGACDPDYVLEAIRTRLEQPPREPVGWIYEDDEGRMMFTQMPHPDPLWEPVYRTQK
jgi:hypothetical protein